MNIIDKIREIKELAEDTEGASLDGEQKQYPICLCILHI